MDEMILLKKCSLQKLKMKSLLYFLPLFCFLFICKADDDIELDNICFAFEDDEHAEVFIDISRALLNSTGIIDKNNMRVEKFNSNGYKYNLDTFTKLGRSGKCGVVFSRYKGIRSNVSAIEESNRIYNQYDMYVVNSVLGTLPLCYNRLVRGYLTCDSSFKCMII